MLCFCFLAYGEEHINEFNIVAKSILKLDPTFKIVVATDLPGNIVKGVYKIVKLEEEFNYNLKRAALAAALEEFNTVLFLDTDMFLRTGIDFSEIDSLKDGIYVAEVVGLDSLRDVYGSLDYMSDYLKKLKTIYSGELFLVHEGYFILKIESDQQKEKFLQHWQEIDEQTRPYQRLAYNLPGAMEGIIIWIALQKANINIELTNKKAIKIFERLSHFGKRGCKLEKTLI